MQSTTFSRPCSECLVNVPMQISYNKTLCRTSIDFDSCSSPAHCYTIHVLFARLLLPMMQSYSRAGDFTVMGQIRSAVFENLLYYGTYFLIFGLCLIYVAIRPDLNIDGQVEQVDCVITFKNNQVCTVLQVFGSMNLKKKSKFLSQPCQMCLHCSTTKNMSRAFSRPIKAYGLCQFKIRHYSQITFLVSFHVQAFTFR